ncbi:MAG: ZIP family metal transporter [Planctomycetota bacterium]
MEHATAVVLGSLAAGLSTGVGALPILLLREVRPAATSAMLGFGAGVMIAASSFTLVGGAFTTLHERPAAAAFGWVALGLLAGAALMAVAERALPHEHPEKGRDGPRSTFVRGAWLFVFAIALHNLPEGLAVGAGFGAPDGDLGLVVAVGIVLQNLPEGLVAAASMRAIGKSRLQSLGIAAATGIVETLGGLLGLGLGGASSIVLALALAFAAGAMLYVVGQEVIPESHVRGREQLATWGLLAGFLAMVACDRLLV